jgi:hypothetical protein
MDDNVHRVVEYAVKTIKDGKAELGDVLELPKSLSEVKRVTPVMTPEQKAIKDIVSAHNVSEEVARQIYKGRQRSAA